MPNGILGTALTGLMAFQRSMQTTSNNVANVNTEGYSRQNTNLESANTTFSDGNYVGNGVNVSNVTRSYDQFISNNIRTTASALGSADRFQSMTAQVDNLMANPDTGMASSMKAFFSATNGVASDPTSIPARQVMVTASNTLTSQFNNVSSQLENLRANNNAYMQTNIDSINSYTQSIADLNSKIASATRGGGSQFPNNLLDQRDQLLAKLSENIDVSTLTRPDGSVDVFIGQGQALISGDSRSTLTLSSSTTDPMQKNVMMNGYDVSNQFASGSLSGAVKFRDQVLDPAQQQLGLVAAGLGIAFNEVHKQGIDLNGAAGRDMFSFQPTEIPVYANNGNNGGGITATFDRATLNQLHASDYRLDYTAGAYSLTRLSDNTKVMLPTGGLPTTVDGMTITETSVPVGTASFMIRPTYQAAKNITSGIVDPTQIAAADGNGMGENVNALALANLETQSTLVEGKSFNQSYQQMVARVGTSANAASVSLSAQKALNNQAVEARANFAGVNLDEEAANLIKFQNAYQASSQVIAISRSLFDSLLAAVR
ncbi:MAG: flagellar hook-associated protein FlgK [Methylococcaceae bacterium]|jgi:flagellar hook-associated protein 1 FlgK